MNIVLTGGTGFLGVHLVRALLEADHRTWITVLTRARPAAALARLTEFLAGPGVDRITVLRGDLTRPRLGLAETDHRELAERCDTIWHCAADIRLGAELADLRRTNVAGTSAVLDLAAACRRQPRFFHVSTAFVAGARRTGTVLPDDLDDRHGFENPYEQSKFETECLVRDWAARMRRPAVVYRPSILVTDRPDRPGMPALGYLDVARTVARLALLARRMPMPTGLEIRLAGDPGGYLNLLPVELAAARMVRLARHDPGGMLTTHHVVHPNEVPVTTVLEVINHVVGQAVDCRVVLVPEPVPEPSLWERLVAGRAAGVLGYLRHRRRYDDRWVRGLDPAQPEIVVDRDYLHTFVRRHAGSTVGRSR